MNTSSQIQEGCSAYVLRDAGLLLCWFCIASAKQVGKSNPIEKMRVGYEKVPFCLFRGCYIVLLSLVAMYLHTEGDVTLIKKKNVLLAKSAQLSGKLTELWKITIFNW